MSIPGDLSPTRRRHFYRRAALAPLCLCLVAGWHLVRVWTCRQTPWKGGGFGMFSTVDDESARFVRGYLVTEAGELPLLIPPAAAKQIAELRAAPTQPKLDDLARRLAEQDWRWRDQRLLREASAVRQRQGLGISAAVVKSLSPGIFNDPIQRVGQDSLEPIPRDEVDDQAISFREVRVECWKYCFDAATQTLRSEPVLSATAPREARP